MADVMALLAVTVDWKLLQVCRPRSFLNWTWYIFPLTLFHEMVARFELMEIVA